MCHPPPHEGMNRIAAADASEKTSSGSGRERGVRRADIAQTATRLEPRVHRYARAIACDPHISPDDNGVAPHLDHEIRGEGLLSFCARGGT